jgi:hypothetical protein
MPPQTSRRDGTAAVYPPDYQRQGEAPLEYFPGCSDGKRRGRGPGRARAGGERLRAGVTFAGFRAAGGPSKTVFFSPLDGLVQVGGCGAQQVEGFVRGPESLLLQPPPRDFKAEDRLLERLLRRALT